MDPLAKLIQTGDSAALLKQPNLRALATEKAVTAQYFFIFLIPVPEVQSD
jgi:hypothetical protein